MKKHMQSKHYQGIAHTSRGDAVVQTLDSSVEDILQCPKVPQMSRITWRSTSGKVDGKKFLVDDVETDSDASTDWKDTRRFASKETVSSVLTATKDSPPSAT